VPVLSDSVPRLGLRPERVADEHLGRNQQATQRVYAGDLGFWLLTSGFYILKGYQGRSPWLVRRSETANNYDPGEENVEENDGQNEEQNEEQNTGSPPRREEPRDLWSGAPIPGRLLDRHPLTSKVEMSDSPMSP
jgi:hypothetical protein